MKKRKSPLPLVLFICGIIAGSSIGWGLNSFPLLMAGYAGLILAVLCVLFLITRERGRR